MTEFNIQHSKFNIQNNLLYLAPSIIFMANQKSQVVQKDLPGQKERVIKKERIIKHSLPMFSRENYMWMLAGAVLIAIGFFLMAGGKSEDPNVFDEKEVYSTTRITIAPILIIIGLIVEVFAIFRKPKG